jgi:hypothetical protein
MRCCLTTVIYGVNELVGKIFVLRTVSAALVPSSCAVVYTAETCQFVDLEIAFVMFVVNLILLTIYP